MEAKSLEDRVRNGRVFAVGAGREPVVPILFEAAARDAIIDYFTGATNIERGAVMVGRNWTSRSYKQIIYVDDTVLALDEGTAYAVTADKVGPNARQLLSRRPYVTMSDGVGTAHSHNYPYTASLSHIDVNTHIQKRNELKTFKEFYGLNAEWVSYVYAVASGEEGMFVGGEGDLGTPVNFYLIGEPKNRPTVPYRLLNAGEVEMQIIPNFPAFAILESRKVALTKVVSTRQIRLH